MNEREISEIKRILSPTRNAIHSVHGCYVNAEGAIIAKFNQSVALMEESELEKYLGIFKRTLSGGIGKNLINIPFSSEVVLNGEEHKLLMALRENPDDESLLDSLYSKIGSSYKSEDNYVILLIRNAYDVPKKNKNDDADEDSVGVYTFISCAVCPVKSTKAALTYDSDGKKFVNFGGSNAISAPELGFLFPSFDNRETNIYDTLFYTRSDEETYEELTLALFKNSIKMPAKLQSQTFKTVLAESMESDCSFSLARSVHKQIRDKIEEHKESRDPTPLTLTQTTVKDILSNCGVSNEKLTALEQKFTESFGKTAELPPKNIINPSKFELKTPNVTVNVAKGYEDLVDIKVINGQKFIVIRADEGVEVNGLNVSIEE